MAHQKALQELENFFTACQFTLRYAKGNFKSGYCLLNEQKMIIINSFASSEKKVEILLTLASDLNLPYHELNASHQKILKHRLKLG